jgi:hypothetical protein
MSLFLLYGFVELTKLDILLGNCSSVEPANSYLLSDFPRQLLDKLHLCSEEGAVNHDDRSLTLVFSKCPVDKRCLSRLGRAIDDMGVADQFRFAINFGGVGLSKGNHPLFVGFYL